MKNVFKARVVPLFGLIILTAIIGFAVGCSSPSEPGGEPPVQPTFVAVTNITGIPSTKLTGTDLTLTGTVQPSDATNKTITWSIAADDDNSTVPSFTGNVLKTTSEGTVKITATVVNGLTATTPYTQNFTITVSNTPPAFIPVSDITGVPAAATVNANLTLTGSVEPSDATNKAIVWSIATANALSGATVTNGVFKATAAGTATVTATITNGATATTNYTKNFTITVTDSVQPQPFNDISAAELVAKIKIGWNLGNTLDAHKGDGSSFPSDVAGMETYWSNPVTTKAMITKLKSEGFNGIRIPVTWYKVTGAAPNYTIRADWMARVKAVVDYAVDNDMYILLNTHHDEEIFKFTNAGKTASLNAFTKIWAQIADTFKDYDEKLIFEGLNEPRTKGTDWEWNGGNPEERANLNDHYQAFVDTVRASGGNNGKRILMVNTHAASASPAAVNGLIIPTDPGNTKNKIIVSIHAYSPFEFAHQYGTDDAVATWSKDNPTDVSGVTGAIDPAYNKFVVNGIPVIIGEFGSREEKAATYRAEWSEFYTKYARNKGIPCFLWDDNGWFKLFNRSNLTFYVPSVLAALMKGVNDATLPPVIEPGENGGGDPTPSPITGNMGDYRFGLDEDGVTPVYQQAVWTLSGANLTTAKAASAKLVLVFSQNPSAVMQLVWQGPDNAIWWKSNDILGNTGSPIGGTGTTWNAGTKTLTINLADALADYGSFTAQSSLNIIIAYYGVANINDLGIVSANLQ